MMFQVVQAATGIGDALIALTVAKGLKEKHPDATVVYTPHPPTEKWVLPFDGYDVLGKPPRKPDRVFKPFECNKLECSERSRPRGRADYYAMFCDNVKPTLPTLKISLPPSEHPGCVLLAPWSNWSQREYKRFPEIEKIFLERGEDVVIVDDRARPRHSQYRGTKFVGREPAQVYALLRKCKFIIGNDSGIAHCGGAIGAKTIALCGPTTGQVFSVWPTVRAIQGPMACTGCYWVNMAFNDCLATCHALQALEPMEIYDKATSSTT